MGSSRFGSQHGVAYEFEHAVRFMLGFWFGRDCHWSVGIWSAALYLYRVPHKILLEPYRVPRKKLLIEYAAPMQILKFLISRSRLLFR